VDIPKQSNDMARGNQREMSREKNQAKIDLKLKQAGKVNTTKPGVIAIIYLKQYANSHSLSLLSFFIITYRAEIRRRGTKVTRGRWRPRWQPKS
jgi:hypothetical protein